MSRIARGLRVSRKTRKIKLMVQRTWSGLVPVTFVGLFMVSLKNTTFIFIVIFMDVPLRRKMVLQRITGSRGRCLKL